MGGGVDEKDVAVFGVCEEGLCLLHAGGVGYGGHLRCFAFWEFDELADFGEERLRLLCLGELGVGVIYPPSAEKVADTEEDEADYNNACAANKTICSAEVIARRHTLVL